MCQVRGLEMMCSQIIQAYTTLWCILLSYSTASNEVGSVKQQNDVESHVDFTRNWILMFHLIPYGE